MALRVVQPMQALLPPLEVEDDETENGVVDVLPKEVRANFEAMAALVQAQKRTGIEAEETTGCDASSGRKKRKQAPADDNSFLSRDEEQGAAFASDGSGRFELAVKTALSAESEIERLKNGIAELEALFLQQQEGGVEGLDPVPFPLLPSVVPEDQDEISKEQQVESVEKLESQKTQDRSSVAAKSLLG